MRGKIKAQDGTEATLEDGVWSSDDHYYASLLNSETKLLAVDTGPDRPDPDGEILIKVSERVLATIIEDTPPKMVRGRVY